MRVPKTQTRFFLFPQAQSHLSASGGWAASGGRRGASGVPQHGHQQEGSHHRAEDGGEATKGSRHTRAPSFPSQRTPGRGGLWVTQGKRGLKRWKLFSSGDGPAKGRRRQASLLTKPRLGPERTRWGTKVKERLGQEQAGGGGEKPGEGVQMCSGQEELTDIH